MNEESFFAEALKHSDPAERAAFLEQACGNDAELRRRIEELLKSHEQAGSFLDQPAANADAASDVPTGQWIYADELPETPLEGVGSRIKQYKLLQQIGEGGMGVVFMAEQQEPVRRMVALKVIKAGMDSAQVIARFEQERQALALMDHPNIAKVLDAGTTASGRPFFVMELVKGIPITKYCDEQRLSPKQRLELFVPVCQAIQHAHQKGIIHRDIKPSNVLIAAYDGKPVPKVIDFGVAKATGQKLTERTLFTGFGGLVGTLEYMSPEQAEFNALDIDTRSDVYSLGVLLYELLTGTTPLSRQRIKDAAIMEVLRLIREEEPPRPSTRLSESKDSLASVSAQRQSEPSALIKTIRGEVDWMVMKALEKDRTRRYETANGLARDIQRYLAEEPVEAGPPSARYRLRKLAWKHRRGLATAAALLLLLLVGVVLSSILAAWALREQRLANQRLDETTAQKERAEQAEMQVREQLEAVKQQKERAEKAETQAKGNEAEARQQQAKAEQSEADTKAVLDFFQDKVLSAGRPKDQGGGLGRDVKLREAVDQASEKIADAFTDRPLVESSIRHTLGLTYYYLGEWTLAIRQLERALVLREAKLGANHLDTLISRTQLAAAYWRAGRVNEAIQMHKQTLEQKETKLGADHLEALNSRAALAAAYLSAGRTLKAIPLLQQVLKQRETQLGPKHPDTLTTRDNLAVAYQMAGRTAEALHLFEQTLKQRELLLGAEHPTTIVSRNNLAGAYRLAGRLADAIRLSEQTVKQAEVHLGPEHPVTLVSRTGLAQAYQSAGRTADAIRLNEQTLKQSEAKNGPDHPDTLISRNNLATAYLNGRRTAEAIRLFEQTLKQKEAKLGPDHPDTLTSRNNLAAAYRTAGRIEEAIHLCERSLKQREAKLGPDHPDTLQSRNNLAAVYQSAGRTSEAIRLLEPTLKRMETRLGPDHRETLTSRHTLAVMYVDVGRIAEAIRLHEPNLKHLEAKLGLDHPDTLRSLANLGVSYREAGRSRDAIASLEEALQRGRKRPEGLPASVDWIPGALAETYERAKQFTKAEPLYRVALDQTRKRFGADDLRTAGQIAVLGLNLLHQHKYAEAEPLLRDCLKVRQAKQPDAWNTFNTQSVLGGALLGQKKCTDAEPLLLGGYQGMKQREAKIPPQGKPRLREALERLVQLYEAAGKKDEAEKWHQELSISKTSNKK